MEFSMVGAVRSIAIVVLMTLGLSVIGFLSGEAIGYGIAWVLRRDPAELKDLLIWCLVTAPVVFGIAGFWLSVRMLTERPWLKRFALSLFLVVAFCSTAIIVLTYLDAPRYS